MPDEDLFSDNTAHFDPDNITSEDLTNNSNTFFANSPNFHKFINDLRYQFNNINSFDFDVYPRIYYYILDHMQYTVRSLSNSNYPFSIAFQEALKDNGSHSYEDILTLKEYERCIMASGYFNEILNHITVLLKDNSLSFEEGTYVQYVYDHFLKEYNISTIYLSQMIDNYVQFCNTHNYDIDSLLVDFQIKSFMTVLERQLYGNFVHAAEIENIGKISLVVEERDKFTLFNAEQITLYIFAIEKVITDIKEGNLVDVQAAFS